jgi:hypothetical protein
MSKKGRVQQARLDAMEQEFKILLPKCLAECAKGRWGLFGQNSIADQDDRYWTWPEAKHLRELASDIRLERSNAGEVNALVERFLGLCGAGKSNVEGEPKLALVLLEEIRGKVNQQAPCKRGLRQVHPAGRRAKAWCANPRPGTSFTYKQHTGPHEYKENSCQL